MQSRSRGQSQISSVILSQEGGAALDEQDPELWDLDEDEAEEMGLRRSARKAEAERTPMTLPPKKTRTAAPGAVEQGGAQASEAQRLSAQTLHNPKNTKLLALSQRACAIIPALTNS